MEAVFISRCRGHLPLRNPPERRHFANSCRHRRSVNGRMESAESIKTALEMVDPILRWHIEP